MVTIPTDTDTVQWDAGHTVGVASGAIDGFQADAFVRVDVTAGLTYTFAAATKGAYSNDAELDVYDDQGNLLTSASFSTFASAAYTPAASGHVFISVHNYSGLPGPYEFFVSTNSATNHIVSAQEEHYTGVANERILGSYTHDYIIMGAALEADGGFGDDTIFGNAFADSISGGAGNDYLQLGSGGGVLWGGDGVDTLSTNGSYGTFFGGAGEDRIYGGGGVDIVHGGTESDFVRAGGGADQLWGDEGNDYLEGGAGADTMRGGAGSDIFSVDDAGDKVIEANVAGVDTVNSSVSFSLAGQYVEKLTLTGSEAINGTGNTLDNDITGNAGVNTLTGGKGDDDYYVQTAGDKVVELDGQGLDRVYSTVSFSLASQYIERLGLQGSDNINGTGNSLDNSIVGNTGNNVIDGGKGSDRIAGGAGADTFVFSATLGSSNVDVITDFKAVDDTFRLDDAAFKGLALGALAADAFHIGTAAADAQDRIVYNSTSGALFFDRDGTGSTYAAVQFATLENHATVTNADFMVI